MQSLLFGKLKEIEACPIKFAMEFQLQRMIALQFRHFRAMQRIFAACIGSQACLIPFIDIQFNPALPIALQMKGKRIFAIKMYIAIDCRISGKDFPKRHALRCS